MAKDAAVPFLKWAGGKRWLSNQLSEMTSGLQYNRYIEPFLGGGASFFALNPKSALLSDVNVRLIECYLAIRDDWHYVQSRLEYYQAVHNKDFYYSERGENYSAVRDRAAQFLYLNRTCWNGLYRVNKMGSFNVPIGTKTNVLLEGDNFKLISERLSDVDIRCLDFECAINKADQGDLIFADPPYTVKHNNNGFVKYNENIFSWDDQVRLSNALKRAKSRGAFVVATNAAHECISGLYADFDQRSLQRKSVISGKKEARGQYEELLLVGGWNAAR